MVVRGEFLADYTVETVYVNLTEEERFRYERAREVYRTFLSESGVGTEVYYPLPLHLQPALASYGHKAGEFPVSEQLSKEVLALPIFAELTEEEIAAVAGLIREFYGRT